MYRALDLAPAAAVAVLLLLFDADGLAGLDHHHPRLLANRLKLLRPSPASSMGHSHGIPLVLGGDLLLGLGLLGTLLAHVDELECQLQFPPLGPVGRVGWH